MADQLHGALFDSFSRQASHSHGGSYFDSGFGAAALNEAHGRLYDLFGVPKDTDAHGERWDEFDWKDMPTLHGQHFDSDFQAPETGGEHGSTWFDVFRGGRTQARVMVNGQDVEGTVIEVTRDYAKLKGRDGQIHEVGLSQFLAFRTPTQEQAGPEMPMSDADAPSAHDHTAHGGGWKPESTEIPSPVGHVTPGGSTGPRDTSVPDGLMDTFMHLKALADDLDVEKSEPFTTDHRVLPENVSGLDNGTPVQFKHNGTVGAGTITKRNVKPGFHRVDVGASWHPSVGFGAMRGTHDLPHGSITHAQTAAGASGGWSKPGIKNLGKSMDTTATAVQGSPTAKTVTHRANCPRGGSAPCGADVDGHCTLCGASVKDHEAVGKAGGTKAFMASGACGKGGCPSKSFHTIGNGNAACQKCGAVHPMSKFDSDPVAQKWSVSKDFGSSADVMPGGQTNTLTGQARNLTPHGQARTDPPDMPFPERDHKTSDHHMQLGAKAGVCPHCGQVMDELDVKTEQGAGRRQHKQGAAAEFSSVTAHKCVGRGLDVLKSVLA